MPNVYLAIIRYCHNKKLGLLAAQMVAYGHFKEPIKIVDSLINKQDKRSFIAT